MSEVLAREVVFAEARFSDLATEGDGMFWAHWAEANVDSSTPVDPDWELYRQLEGLGLEVCVTARVAARLVGYAVYMLSPSLHYRGLVIGDADVYYLHPLYRRGWVGVEMFRFAERLLRQRGAHVMHTRVKLHIRNGRVGSVMRWLGCRPTEIHWRKVLN